MTAIHDWHKKYHHFTCAGSSRVVQSSPDDRAAYESFDTIFLFTTGICNNDPPRALFLAMHAVKRFLPEDMHEILTSAKAVALDDDATKQQLKDQLAILTDYDVKNDKPIQYCRRSLMNLLKWRIKMPINPGEVEKRFFGCVSRLICLLSYHQKIKNADQFVTAYLKTVMPFEVWQKRMIDEVYSEERLDEYPDYLPIGE